MKKVYTLEEIYEKQKKKGLMFVKVAKVTHPQTLETIGFTMEGLNEKGEFLGWLCSSSGRFGEDALIKKAKAFCKEKKIKFIK